jgi:hypothetical protein
MPEREAKSAGSAGVSSSGEVDVQALFDRLSEEVRLIRPRRADGGSASIARLNARSTAERLWPVSAERPSGGRGGPVGAAFRPIKAVVRRLVRWYVEPPLADQRGFNDALLRLVDDLATRVDELEARVRELESEPRS